ncbi:MAG: carboxypeptidase-like regulatory domain-containing protein [Gemmatimonadetes bacterium]|nr:carboxypeptidase-like regulatory domain-containing protein [Gemmatimonadota bacterium]
MKRLLTMVVLATAALTGSVRAQDRIADGKSQVVGRVVDETGRALVGAGVAFEGSDWGTLTGETGRFVLARENPGEITLTAELIGYEKLVWTGRVEEGQELGLTMVSKPILLEGLTVVADRLESRRRSTPVAVRWLGQHALATAPQENALEFVVARGGLTRVPCRGMWGNECVLARGSVVEPSVWVDEAPFIGGFEYLRTLQPHELYLVEIYAGGRHIRAYTNRYMERAAEMRAVPMALLF